MKKGENRRGEEKGKEKTGKREKERDKEGGEGKREQE